MPKQIAGEPVQKELSSREGVVYLTSKYAYKVFGGRTNSYEVLATYKKAELAGVPVPGNAKFAAELQDGTRTQTVEGIRSNRAWGRFFQLSKPGGERVLINEIQQTHNRELLRTILKGLERASAAGLMDPQGFINANSSPPLCFIDVHLRATPNIAFEAAILAARQKLNQLG